MSQQDQNDKSQHFYRASAADFMKIPGYPVAYWVGPKLLDVFVKAENLGELAEVKHGLSTGNNAAVVRLWSEVSYCDFGIGYTDRESALNSLQKWFPYNKGGQFRKWFGNCEFVLRYDKFGNDLMSSFTGHRHDGKSHYFREGVTWTFISSSNFAARYTPPGFIFDVSGSSLFIDKPKNVVGFLCGKICYTILKALNPTLNFQVGNLKALPILTEEVNKIEESINFQTTRAIKISEQDWNTYETSWEFLECPLIKPIGFKSNIRDSFNDLRGIWLKNCNDLLAIEEENNRLYITAYGLVGELDSKVEMSDITLTCNTYYRYGENRTEEERETLLRCDTLQELISYSIGCMMGRYSIDKPGLILASQGETLQDYLNQIPNPRFMPDHDAILPLTDQEWFADDVTNRVREFVKVVWGEETLQENLAFIAESLCLHAIKPLSTKNSRGESSIETIRRYLSTQFYKDHLKTYKKRPIYWLFSSGKEKAFECLVYLHRYNESSLARMRTEYVTPLMGKYDAQQSLLQEQLNDASSAQQRELEKQLKDLAKKQTELRAFDENLKHYADMRIKLDLDDGVKVNYGKFGNLLADVKAITGDKE